MRIDEELAQAKSLEEVEHIIKIHDIPCKDWVDALIKYGVDPDKKMAEFEKNKSKIKVNKSNMCKMIIDENMPLTEKEK